MDKNAYIISYADLWKGIFIGILIGAAVMFLIMQGIIPVSFLSPAKVKG
jgi:hypothetical protein